MSGTKRLNYALGKRGVTPLAMATFALGILLVVMGDWNILESEWLGISIILFLITVLEAQLVTLPTVRKLVELTVDTEGPTAGGSEEPHNARLYRRHGDVRVRRIQNG